jgi:TRAP-type C4-dicarboxylate transport system substrate-binding protein
LTLGVRAALAAVASAALAATNAACAAGGGDKAGGKANEHPLVLTLATYDERDPVEFARAVERLSRGSIRIDVTLRTYGERNYERHAADDVRHGNVDLGLVGARVWDTLGVPSFSALLAPFLVDSLAHEQRVLESPLATRMLEGVERADVVGVALLPGELRFPWGISGPLVGLQDYHGARVGIHPGRVARATFRALGATPENAAPGDPTGLDGAEFERWVIAFAGRHRRAGVLATNVVLWPRPQTIVINRETFNALTTAQREILRRAGREALGPAFTRIAREQERMLELICQRGSPALATASPAELAALRKAVQPVYDDLERDAQTKELIAGISKLGGRIEASARPSRCTGARATHPRSQDSRLEGRWQVTWTRQDLVDAGLSVKGLPKNWRATVVYEFANGRFTGNSGERGTYEIDANVVHLVFETGRFVQLGEVYSLGWSVYRDSLTFSRVPGSEPLQAIVIKPWTRVR